MGEVIKNEEAEERGKVYDAEGHTYLFDLDYIDGEHHPYTIDAAAYGNISHFINHSWDQTLQCLLYGLIAWIPICQDLLYLPQEI